MVPVRLSPRRSRLRATTIIFLSTEGAISSRWGGSGLRDVVLAPSTSFSAWGDGTLTVRVSPSTSRSRSTGSYSISSVLPRRGTVFFPTHRSALERRPAVPSTCEPPWGQEKYS